MLTEIFWSGEKKEKFVDAWGFRDKILVQPYAVRITDGFGEMGILIKIFRSDDPEIMVAGFFWGLVIPQEPVTSWRGARILEYLNKIESGTLCECWYAGTRRELQGYDRERRQKIIRLIGRVTHQKIMKGSVPKKVVQAIIKMGAEEDSRISTSSLVDEIKAGTLGWQEEFLKLGIERP